MLTPLKFLRSWFESAKQFAANSASALIEFRDLAAANEFKPDGDGWFQVSPYGNFPHPKGIQSFHKEDAEKLVNAFNSMTNLGTRAFGLPFYRGHPDADRQNFPDDRAYGRIKEMRVGANGLEARAAFNAKGKELIEGGEYHGHSPYWKFTQDPNKRGVIRPVELISIGFTNQPNIPVKPITAANDESMNDTLKKLAKSLGLVETATETEIETKIAAISAAANELPGIRTQLGEAQTKITALGNDLQAANNKATKAENDLTAANGKVTALTGERDAFKRDGEAANAEREARTKLILDTAINTATITAAERATLETEFKGAGDDTAFNSIATRVQTKTASNFRTTSQAQGRTAANGKTSPGWEKFHAAVNAKRKDGMSYDQAFNSCKGMEEFKSLHESTDKQA